MNLQYRHPGVARRVGGVLLLAATASGCNHQSSWESRNEVGDLVDQIAATAMERYQPPVPSQEADVVGHPAAVLDGAREVAARLGDTQEVLRSAVRERLYDIRRETGRLVLTPRYRGTELAALGDGDRTQLRVLMAAAGETRALGIEVVGHASAVPLGQAVGDRFADNTALSLARAQAVADFLATELGVPREAIAVRGAGSDEPLPGRDPADAANRRVEILLDRPGVAPPVAPTAAVPEGFTPWWQALVQAPIASAVEPLAVDLEGLYVRAIEHSHQVSVFSTLPLIRDTAVVEAEGEFDPRAFIESRLRHANEPVGSTLRTGGPTRFREDEWRVTGGVRKHTWTGADIELSQRVGVVDSNSLFFVPDDQAQTELSLSVTQPLLNRAGLEYNRSTVRIARLDGEIAMEEFRRQVGAHLLELTRAYWALYLQRGALVIRTRLAEETRTLLERLQSRRGVDTLESQVLKARAALAAREADTIRAAAAVRNAEARIASLVNDPDVQSVDGVELVPVLAPQGVRKQVELDQAARFALDNRAEIIEAVKQLQAGMVRLQMSESELLPVLDLLMEVSWQGLEGRSSTGRALRTQVDADGPSWTVGLLLDVPLGNRVANARHERRRLEVRQLTDQLRATVETLLLEVQVAVREVNVGWREQHARYHAMQARGAELEGLEQRGVLGADSPALGGLLVDELLGAQERLRDSEHAFLEAQVSYSLALANLDRAMGLMLQARDYRLERGADADGLPTLDLRAP